MPLSLSFGKNNLSAWLYGKESTKGLIIVTPGHSLGDYAVTAVLNFPHRIDAVVSSAGFSSEKEQWECSIKRFTGPAYYLIKPINLLFIHFKYGADKNLSAVSGINKSQISVLVI